jgi:uncharacterized protein YciI
VKYLMEYHPGEDFRALARLHIAAHRARLQEFHDRGGLLMAGPLGDPPTGRAMGIFTSRDAAEEFIAGDPFVTGGVVSRWEIHPWHDVLAP